MLTQKVEPQRYLIAVLLGAVLGGIVASVTKAIPKIMSEMMAQMRAEGIDPAEMCQRMMANFNQRQSTKLSTEESRA